MKQSDTDALIGTLESIATSLETLTRLACHMATNAGVPADVIAPPESDIPSGQG